tara:strand:- start:1918 stop:2115 length:198 start_codon:yes stop_codon:yes gene_type:complete
MPPIISRHCDAGWDILFGAGRVVITFIFNAFLVFIVSPLYSMERIVWPLLLDIRRGAYSRLYGYN